MSRRCPRSAWYHFSTCTHDIHWIFFGFRPNWTPHGLAMPAPSAWWRSKLQPDLLYGSFQHQEQALCIANTPPTKCSAIQGCLGGRWRANFRKPISSSQEMIQEDKQKYLKRSQADLGPCGPVMKDRRGQNLSPAQLPTSNTRILRAQGCTDRSAGYSEGCAISRFGAALYTPFVEVDLRST